MRWVPVDQAGRVVLPKRIRDELHLSPGDLLEVSVQGDEVRLRPRRASTPLRRKEGIWVFSTGEPMRSDETVETVREIRAERDRRNTGESR